MTTARTTESIPLALTNNAQERQARLATRVSALRSKAATGNLDRLLLIVGGILMPLGLLVVILGWVGASRTPLVFEQIPYLLSGAGLGLGLVFAGGFTYFSYWQTVRVRDSREQQRELITALRRVEARIALLEGSNQAAATSTSKRSTSAATATKSRTVVTASALVATTTGTMVHTADCPVVAGRDKLKKVAADGGGLKPCKICEPLG